MDYEHMKIVQLRALCRGKGIDTSTMLEKGDFVTALQKVDPPKQTTNRTNGSSSRTDYEHMKISELKSLCRDKGIDTSNMLEKADFVKALQGTSGESGGNRSNGNTNRVTQGGRKHNSSSHYEDMKVSELKNLCQNQGINTTGMFDKQEMVDALHKANPKHSQTPAKHAATSNKAKRPNAQRRASTPADPKPIKKAQSAPSRPAARQAIPKPATTTNTKPAVPSSSTPVKSKFAPFKRSAATPAANKSSAPAATPASTQPAKPRRSSGTATPTNSKQPPKKKTPLPSTPEFAPKPVRKANSAASKPKPSPASKPKPTKPHPDGVHPSINTTPDTSLSTVPPLAERNSTNYTATDVEAAFKAAPKSKWKTTTQRFSGSIGFRSIGQEEDKRGKSIEKGIEKFHEKPHKYAAMMYQTAMVQDKWPTKNQAYTYIMRKGTNQLQAQNVDPKGKWTILIHHYQHLPPFPNNKMPQKDPYTTTVLSTHKGRKLPPPFCPGRGMGINDLPSCKIIGDVDPSDIKQGEVGDCWLLSAISAIAEFDGAIKRLFRKTKRIDEMPLDDGSVNFYTITLWDLTTWEEVDIVVDESLCASAVDPGQLLASKPSEDGELWVPYLEKALAIHCGGWDEITGGQCTHGWSLMTGCREQYTIMRDPKTKRFYCTAKLNPATRQWAKHFNSPKRGSGGVYRCPWPDVGGGGPADLQLSEDELYDRMCAWDREDFIVAAGTKGTSDKKKSGGMVDNHAYSVIDCHPKVAGTKIDLMKVRNPWGQGEIEDGDFDDDGPGWDKYPQIKAELKPVVADDGIFYLTKEEFFTFFDHLYVSAKSMSAFKED